jgi:hypothetical protein
MASDTAGTLDYVNDSETANRQAAATSEAMSAAMGSISNPISRDILPSVDLDDPGETAWSGDVDVFVQTPGSDLNAGESVTAYEIDSDTGRADDRVIAVYGFEVESGGSLVDVIRFRGSDGQVFERAQVQGLDSQGDVQVDRQSILRSPVLFRPQDNGSIDFVFGDGYTGAEDDAVKIKLLGVTVEKRGRKIGNRS